MVNKDDPALDPYEINFLPQFQHGRGPRSPFVNSSGVVIGDHQYDSPQSPLNRWTTDTDPAVMSGDEWVHPFKDIGFLRDENRDYFEKGIPPQPGIFMHPDKDAAYAAGLDRPEKEQGSELES
ncbi:DUF3905 domain-containing protein [Paenibacillus spongiae]|uniref:DUF3905 domain-containing protein n=1 Tax=Paenibacillus spongiae TaxID=2909671 RepID=A0ABY5SID1_9BACL|nr:DUF3905 domain-containing protein [Paenibacillus spongiae]UVI33757.1 DUF3905 domain-containing protein [Paenibacillus spongiae]